MTPLQRMSLYEDTPYHYIPWKGLFWGAVYEWLGALHPRDILSV
jgi:hypothetical protein